MLDGSRLLAAQVHHLGNVKPRGCRQTPEPLQARFQAVALKRASITVKRAVILLMAGGLAFKL